MANFYKLGYELLPYPSYSLDLASSDANNEIIDKTSVFFPPRDVKIEGRLGLRY